MVGPGPKALGPVGQRCDLCELHPGQCDGMPWEEVVETFGVPDWDRDPGVPIAPGGESWSEFVVRASDAVREVAGRHPGELVVAAVHAGVIEATHDLVPRHPARRLPARLGAHHPRVDDRVGVGDRRGPLDPAPLQRLLRGTAG